MIIPHAVPYAVPKYDFKKVLPVVFKAGATIDQSAFVKIVGKENVEHLRWVIGNYWEQKIAQLDTDKLFQELRILFKSKRKAKRTMNETRDEIAARVIDHDWNKIWGVFCKKIDRAIWRHVKTKNVLSQTVHLRLADLVVEENSTCEVQFDGKGYTVDVEGRRSVVGQLTAIYGDRVRIMNIKNRFVGRTFWQCQGRSHVANNEPTLFDNL
jgi:hypothetical protein